MGQPQVACDELAPAMQIEVMAHPTRFSTSHASYPMLVGLCEVGRVAAKFAGQSGCENFIDRATQRLAILIGLENHQAGPPLVVGGALRVITEHVGPLAD